MDRDIEEYVEKLIQDQLDFRSAFGDNDDVYWPRPAKPGSQFDLQPCSIYLYYIKLNAGHLPVVDHYFYPGGDPDNLPPDAKPISLIEVPERMREIAQAINLGQGAKYQKPQTVNYSFQSISWRRVSYVAFIFDDPSWKFVTRRLPDPSPTPTPGSTPTAQPTSTAAAVVFNLSKGPATPNHSFYEGNDVEIDVSSANNGTQIRAGFHMTNFLAAEGGQPLQTSERYVFDMYLCVPYSRGGKSFVLVFDPSGTNDGPPAGPPP